MGDLGGFSIFLVNFFNFSRLRRPNEVAQDFADIKEQTWRFSSKSPLQATRFWLAEFFNGFSAVAPDWLIFPKDDPKINKGRSENEIFFLIGCWAAGGAKFKSLTVAKWRQNSNLIGGSIAQISQDIILSRMFQTLSAGAGVGEIAGGGEMANGACESEGIQF